MKKLILIALITTLLLIAACAKTTTQTIETDQGEATVTTTEGTQGPDWCKKDTSWTYEGGEGEAEMKIIGLETYKGKQMCHATYDVEADQQKVKIDYYFSQDSKGEMEELYMVMNVDGETFEQHITDFE